MQLYRVPVAWSGPSVVGLAVNVLHFDATNQTAPPVAAIASAYQQLSPMLPAGTQIVVPGSGDTIDDTTGNLSGQWSATAPATVGGGSDSGAAAGVGVCVGWTTGAIVPGKLGKTRRLRGRTFIVPLQYKYYDTDGTLTANALAAARAFGGSLLNAGGFGIWHRPTTKGGTNGTSSAVLSYKVNDRVAFLSSRRQ